MTPNSDPADHQRAALLAQVAAYRQATADFLAVAEALTEADLDAQPAQADGWTPRMVVHHMADAEANAYIRLRRLLAEPAGSPIHGYDEEVWAEHLFYDRPITASLAVVSAVRESSAELLDRISPIDLARTGVHTDSGTFALADWLEIYVAHPLDHAEQIRAALG